MATASLILGIVSIIFCIVSPLTGLIGIILGTIALHASKKENKPKGLAIAGLTTSIIGLILGSILWVTCFYGYFTIATTSSDKAKVSSAKTQIGNFSTALETYKLDNGNYPTTEQGLNALVEKPKIKPIPQEYSPRGYLNSSSVPTDPWHNTYYYKSDDQDFVIISAGQDGKEGTKDDIRSDDFWK
jgi:general secretion pathway protein G